MPVLPSTVATTGLMSLRTLLRTRLLLGYYCPLGARASHCLAWIYCVSFANILSILLITAVKELGYPLAAFVPLIIEYGGNVLISLVTAETHFFNYLKGIELIDREMGSDLPLITPATGFIYFIIIAENIVIWFATFIMSVEIGKFSLAMVTLLTALNLNHLIVTLPFDLLRLRLRLLRQNLEVNLNHQSLNNTNDRIEILQNSLKLYKKMLDNFTSTFNWAKLRIIIALFCCFYIFVIHGHRLVYDVITARYVGLDLEMAKWMVHVLDFLFNSLLPCLPVIFSELVSREYEQLKITVGNLLLLCNDNQLRDELELAAEYLDLRPFKPTILRVMTLDSTFVLTFIGLCTTSLIVIIQTTGLI